MFFVAAPSLPSTRNPTTRRNWICSQYLPPAALNVQFDVAQKSGSFGKVFFGEFSDPVNPNALPRQVVVKCPVASTLGRQLYDMEKYTNLKLRKSRNDRIRFPQYIGEVIVPPTENVAAGLLRLGLVWERVGNGSTLEEYMSSSGISKLASTLGTAVSASPLRRHLAASVLYELCLVLEDIQKSGIVHR